MEMKINFNKLFHFDDSSSQTPSTTSLQNSYQIQQPSIMSTHSNHHNNINLHYKLNDLLFFDQSQQKDQVDILQDLSSIGRSYQNSLQKQNQKMSKKHSKKSDIVKQNEQSQIFVNNFYANDNGQKCPGKRLYYQHKITQQRKQKQKERLKNQKQEQELKQLTFKPALNENSKKILQLAESPMRKLQNMKKSNKRKQQQNQSIKSYAQRKQQQELKNCTFHPVINNSHNAAFTSSRNTMLSSLPQRSEKTKIFQQLYNDHRLKQMRRKMAEQQQLQFRNNKKMTKQHLQQFIQRHDQYMQQKHHKQQILKAVSSQYDLSSGRKLFQPRVKQMPYNYSSTVLLNSSSTKNINTVSPKIKSSSHLDDKESPSSDNNKNGSNNKNMTKSIKSSKQQLTISNKRSPNTNKEQKNMNKKQVSIYELQSEVCRDKNKTSKGQVNSKKSSKNDNSSKYSQLKPYQISKLSNDQANYDEQSNYNKNERKLYNSAQVQLNNQDQNNAYVQNQYGQDGNNENDRQEERNQQQNWFNSQLKFQIPKSTNLFNKIKNVQNQNNCKQDTGQSQFKVKFDKNYPQEDLSQKQEHYQQEDPLQNYIVQQQNLEIQQQKYEKDQYQQPNQKELFEENRNQVSNNHEQQIQQHIYQHNERQNYLNNELQHYDNEENGQLNEQQNYHHDYHTQQYDDHTYEQDYHKKVQQIPAQNNFQQYQNYSGQAPLINQFKFQSNYHEQSHSDQQISDIPQKNSNQHYLNEQTDQSNTQNEINYYQADNNQSRYQFKVQDKLNIQPHYVQTHYPNESQAYQRENQPYASQSLSSSNNLTVQNQSYQLSHVGQQNNYQINKNFGNQNEEKIKLYNSYQPKNGSGHQQIHEISMPQFNFPKRNKEQSSIIKSECQQTQSPPKKTVNIASLLRANKKKKV